MHTDSLSWALYCGLGSNWSGIFWHFPCNSRVIQHGWRAKVHSPWSKRHGPRDICHRPWGWHVACRPWCMVHGPWHTTHKSCCTPPWIIGGPGLPRSCKRIILCSASHRVARQRTCQWARHHGMARAICGAGPEENTSSNLNWLTIGNLMVPPDPPTPWEDGAPGTRISRFWIRLCDVTICWLFSTICD